MLEQERRGEIHKEKEVVQPGGREGKKYSEEDEIETEK